MASPQYSTPYSQLSYPSYTPLSVLPVKQDGSPAWSGSGAQRRSSCSNGSDADLRLLRAAVMRDVALQNSSVDAADAAPCTVKSAWPTPDTAVRHHHHQQQQQQTQHHRAAGVSALSAKSTRTNAPLYAPPPQLQPQRQPTPTIRYSDIDQVRSLTSATQLPHHHAIAHSETGAGSPGAGPRVLPSGAAVVGGTEVDVQSDIVRAAEAAPYLCAFQEECQALLALLNAPARLPPSTAVTTAAAIPPVVATAPDTLPPPPLPHAVSSSPPPSSLSSSPPPVVVATAAADAAPAKTTYAQLLHEMDELASLLQHDDKVEEAEDVTAKAGAALQGRQRQEQQQQPSPPAPPSTALTSVDVRRETPDQQAHSASLSAVPTPRSEKQEPHDSQSQQSQQQQQQQRFSSPRLSPSAAELVTHTPIPFWTAQLLKWVVFLIGKKHSLLRRIQSFENTRAPRRRGAATASACAAAEGGSPPAEASAVRVAEALLRLLRSLVAATRGGLEAWTAGQQRRLCTRVANLLAELTTAEDDVVAELLNDAAAGATMEREGVARLIDPLHGGHPAAVVTKPSPSPAAAPLPPAYRKDMLETIALLETISQENRSLKLQVMNTQDELKTLRDEVQGERDAKNEVAAHFDRVAGQNSDLTAKLRDAVARLEAAEAKALPDPQEAALRGQLDRQTSNLRDLRRELDDAKEECDTLRRTVLQLRDALVRHRAVIDLLTRHRKRRQVGGSETRPSGSRQASSRPESPPMQLIEDILSGVRDAPSSTSTSLTDSEAECVAGPQRPTTEAVVSAAGQEEAETSYDVTDEDSSYAYFV